jgi:YVTN family beta-propeller protein
MRVSCLVARAAGTVALTLLMMCQTTAAGQQSLRRTASDAGIERLAFIAPKARAETRSSAEGPALRNLSSTFVSLDVAPEGDMPREVAYTPDGTQILVVHRDTDNVTFFDTDSYMPIGAVPVGDSPVDIAVTPDGQRAVVPNLLDDTVSIIDIDTRSIEATVPVTGQQPFRIQIVEDSATAVVAVVTDGLTSRFSVIDLETATETTSFATTPQGVIDTFVSIETGITGKIYSRFALAPDGSVIVLPDPVNDLVTLYALDGEVLESLEVAGAPTSVDISDDGMIAVIGHEQSSRMITKIDLVDQAVTGSFTVSADLQNQVIRLTPDVAYAMVSTATNVLFVDLMSGQTTASISASVVGDIEISFDGQYAFVSGFSAWVIDIPSQLLVDTIPFAPTFEAATSPTEPRAVALNNRFREDVHFYDIDGPTGHLEQAVVSGTPPEGDGTYAVDVAPDGSLAVACNLISKNVAIVDLAAGEVRSFVDVGDRPKEVRITPDGDHAVVCATGADRVVIIDLNTDEVVAELPMPASPARVRISPDGAFAYVLNVAGTDQISFIELDGANSSIVEQRPAGQTGSANGYAFTETSGIELSDDGSLLAVCDSFNDLLRIFDTASRSEVATVVVGDFPIRAAFSPSADRVYVTNSFGDSVSVVENSSGDWANVATVPNIDFPLTVDVDEDGAFAYVGNSGTGAGIRVIDAQALSVVRTLLFADGAPRDSHLSRTRGRLIVAATNGVLVRIEAAGPDSRLLGTRPLNGAPADLVYNETTRTALAALPVADGIGIVQLPLLGDIDADGDVDIDDLLLLLGVWGTGDPDADLDGDGEVGVTDLLVLLGAWTPEGLLGDIDGDGDLDIDDLLLLLGAWGSTDPDADLDDDGDVDVDDLLALLSAWF